MTVTYTAEVATCRGLGCFWKLLFRWRGSIYKLLWPNLITYSVIYFTLSGIYRFALSPNHREYFEKVSLHCQAYGDLIPIAFVLGFYVSIVIKRWWDQYIIMPWPDNLAMFVSTLVHGQDDRGRLMRRTMIRYVNLCLVITLRMMSPRVKKRFPTLDHLVEAGFMQPTEKKIFEDLDQKTSHPKYWMPLVWAGGIVTRARKEGRIKDDFATKTLIDELNTFRSGCGGMLNYDWISIPLVYTQVVTLAVYVYFMATIMGNQFLDPSKHYPKHEVDLVVPLFTFLQFFFYMGWLKVAESLVNPFGEDDDDFELNWLVDRNLQVSYVIVDEMHQEHPELVKDQYWDEVFPSELPYTAASKQYQTGPPPLSTDNVAVTEEMAEFLPLESALEEEQERIDDDDVELEMGDGNSRHESHPMSILHRKKSSSSASVVTGSYSVPRTGRKSSVLNMLTRMFRREESNKDIASQMGSSASLTARGRGLRSSSRMSSVSQSQAQSRTSMVRENTYQDEMFHMSDVSLAGSANTVSSQIQMSAPPTTAPNGPLLGSAPTAMNPSTLDSEVAPLLANIPPSLTYTTIAVPTRKFGRQERAPVTEIRGTDGMVRNDGSEDVSSSYTSEWNIIENPATSPNLPLLATTPPMRGPDSFRHRVSVTRRDLADTFPAESCFVDNVMARIVTPSSPPVRQSFEEAPPPTPASPPGPTLAPPPPRRKRSIEGIIFPPPPDSATPAPFPPPPGRRSSDPRIAPPRPAAVSGLARSLQQQVETMEAPTTAPVTTEQLVTILSPTSSVYNRPAPFFSGQQSMLTPTVTMPTAIPTGPMGIPPSAMGLPTALPTALTSELATAPLGGGASLAATFGGRAPPDALVSITMTEPSPPSDAVSRAVSHAAVSEPVPVPSTVVTLEEAEVPGRRTSLTLTPVVEEREREEAATADVDLMEPRAKKKKDGQDGDARDVTSGPATAPYVPTPAIPVPSPSPAHTSTAGAPPLAELIEAAMTAAPTSRLALHDFHELEPIAEHCEHGEASEASESRGDSPPAAAAAAAAPVGPELSLREVHYEDEESLSQLAGESTPEPEPEPGDDDGPEGGDGVDDGGGGNEDGGEGNGGGGNEGGGEGNGGGGNEGGGEGNEGGGNEGGGEGNEGGGDEGGGEGNEGGGNEGGTEGNDEGGEEGGGEGGGSGDGNGGSLADDIEEVTFESTV